MGVVSTLIQLVASSIILVLFLYECQFYMGVESIVI